MNIAMKLVIALFLFMFLTAISNDLSAVQPPENAFEKNNNSKTWEVYYSTTDHMAKGDKFSVKGNGSKVHFKPYYKLRLKWGYKDKSDYTVELDEHTAYFCAMAELDTPDHKKELSGHRPWHMFVIEVTDNEDLKIAWSSTDFETELSGDARDEACDQTKALLHGGMAHAESN